MICPSRSARYWTFLSLALLLCPCLLFAQATSANVRITQPIDESNLVALKGNTHPLARPEFDRGAAPDSQPMTRALLLLQRSPDQEAALRQLLEDQQTNSSPNYYQWLTPEQFGEQFGPSDQDIATVTAWLQSHGFSVNRVSKGRTVIEISGTAGQIRDAFHTEIHRYVVNGESHWANAFDPQIPAALASVVTGFSSLNDFPDQSYSHQIGHILPTANGDRPQLSGQCENSSGTIFNCYAVTPYDFATIYNVLPLWNGTGGPVIDGTGQTIAIVAESDICTAGSPDFIEPCGSIDAVSTYRSAFGLPTTLPSGGPPVQVILDGPNPGIVLGAETEADLDVEVAGAVAKNAQIDLVVAAPTETTSGDRLAAEYIVDNNLAPVMSMSFGDCEADLGAGGNAFFNSLWEQAAAQGTSVSIATGDGGSATCEAGASAAMNGLAVSGIASTPFNVAVGGTDFNQTSLNASTYWNSTNNATTLESADGYIPEVPWNLSCASAGLQGCSGLPQNSPSLVVGGGSGGQSTVYSKPVWQNGPEITGTPATDGHRDIPDVSLFSSVGSSSDAAWIICDPFAVNPLEPTACSLYSGTGYVLIGGTSASAPAIAGIMALVDEYMASQPTPVTRQGNPNYALYYLASTENYSNCASAAVPGLANNACTFYDITSGNNSVPCVGGSPNCSATTSGSTGVLVETGSPSTPAYPATAGYDLATGLGSINVTNLVHNWTSFKRTAPTVTLQLNGGAAVNITHGASVPVSINVTPSSPVPTGDASLLETQGSTTTTFNTFTLSNGSASGSTNFLPGGSSYTVHAHYAGDVNYSPVDSNAVPVNSVSPEASNTAVSVTTYSVNLTTGAVTAQPNATSFPYGTLYDIRMVVTNSSGTPCVSSTTAPFAYPCPTGSVSFTDNGSTLNSNFFPSPSTLNTEGLTEVPSILAELESRCGGCFLSGGSHTLSATYSGDNSYNPSPGSATITITPAPTTTTLTSINGYSANVVVIGRTFNINFDVSASDWGESPDGNATVFDGTTPIAGPLGVLGSGNCISGQCGSLGVIGATVSGASGPHSITVEFDGSQNYVSSVSNALVVNALYPTTMSATANPSTVYVGQNTPVTLTATVDTTNPASNPGLKPTGTVTFQGTSSPVTITAMPDASGNWELQATTTVTPQGTTLYTAAYSGDSNYVQNGQNVEVAVVYPDFSVTSGPAPAPITGGQTGTFTFTITPMTDYASTVTLNCASALIANTPCNFSPSPVSLNNGVPVTVTLSLPVPPPSSNLTAMAAPRRLRRVPFNSPGRPAWWGLSVIAFMAALMLTLRGRGRSLRAAVALASVGLFCFLIGCGGGGGAGGGGGGGGGGGPVATTTTLTTTSTKLAPNASATLTANVAPTSAASGNACFLEDGAGVCSALVNGTAQEAVANPGAPGFVGTHFFAAQFQPSGSALPSQSGQLSIVFTGSMPLAVCGVTGGNSHCLSPTITIQ